MSEDSIDERVEEEPVKLSKEERIKKEMKIKLKTGEFPEGGICEHTSELHYDSNHHPLQKKKKGLLYNTPIEL